MSLQNRTRAFNQARRWDQYREIKKMAYHIAFGFLIAVLVFSLGMWLYGVINS